MTASSRPVLPDDRHAAGVARPAVRHRGRFPVDTGQRPVADSWPLPRSRTARATR
ncbi:hypothetical protein ACF08N_02825 [Streptomyces sp. NPDC015127]|uniref:hypothetical protein n=1 Tax=Streptomyces sp. NPDC015127 TaxID=3364939 RepID=UPI0036F86FF4